jgi:hypothetical protein
MAVEQLDLLAMARATDPEPSHVAARTVRAAELRDKVAEVVSILDTAWNGQGATADEVHAYLDGLGRRVQRNSVSKRLGELTSAGRLVVAEYRRKSPAGVPVTVYLPARVQEPLTVCAECEVEVVPGADGHETVEDGEVVVWCAEHCPGPDCRPPP